MQSADERTPLTSGHNPPNGYHAMGAAASASSDHVAIEIDLPLSQIFIRDIADAVKLAVLAGGCYLSFSGTKSLFDLIGPPEVSYMVAGITALTNFQILRNSSIDLTQFNANKLPCILFAAGNAFTSALLTYREAPVMWQKWAFSSMNGIVNVPFGVDTVIGNINNSADFIHTFKSLDATQRMTLFFNFAMVFAIVLCCLIGYAAPVIALLVEGLSKLMTNSLVIYGLTGFVTALTNCVECFFQINAMLCFSPTDKKTQWFGYISVPWKPRAMEDKLRFCLGIVFSFISSLSFGGFTATTLLPFTPLTGVIIMAMLSLVAPFWSNMKAADSVLAAPFAHFLRHPMETLSGILESAGTRLRPYYLGIISCGPEMRGYHLLNGAEQIV